MSGMEVDILGDKYVATVAGGEVTFRPVSIRRYVYNDAFREAAIEVAAKLVNGDGVGV